MNRLLVNGVNKSIKGSAMMFQRKPIIGSNGTIITRSLDSTIRDREIALENEYVRRIERDNLLAKKRKYQKRKLNKNKPETDKLVLNNKVEGRIGRLSDSGIIF